MPIYEYICPKCKTKFEEWQNINESSALVACPECQTLSERIISNTSFILKGEGWYVTEYGNKKDTNSKTTEKNDQKPKSDLADHSDLSSDKAKTDAKPETNPEAKPDVKAKTKDTSASKSDKASSQAKKDEPKTQKKVEKNND